MKSEVLLTIRMGRLCVTHHSSEVGTGARHTKHTVATRLSDLIAKPAQACAEAVYHLDRLIM